MMRSAMARMGASLRALRADAADDGPAGAQRMRPAGFAEAAHEAASSASRKIRLAFTDLRMAAKIFGKRFSPSPSRISTTRAAAAMLAIVARQFGELGDQLHRQIVHRVEAQVLQGLEHRAFARAAQTGDDHQLRLARRLLRGAPAGVRGRCAGIGMRGLSPRPGRNGRRGGAPAPRRGRSRRRGRPGNRGSFPSPSALRRGSWACASGGGSTLVDAAARPSGSGFGLRPAAAALGRRFGGAPCAAPAWCRATWCAP